MAIEFGPDREEVGQRRVYDPVGFCIDCAATGCRLTDEHPVPSGLQSEHILPQASCATCQKIINEEFEQYVLRHLLGLPRAAFGIKSRRKKPAPLPSIRVRRPDGKVYRLHFEEGPPPHHLHASLANPLHVTRRTLRLTALRVPTGHGSRKARSNYLAPTQSFPRASSR